MPYIQPRPVQSQQPNLAQLAAILARAGEERRRNTLNAYAQLGQGLAGLGQGVGRGMQIGQQRQQEKDLLRQRGEQATERMHEASELRQHENAVEAERQKMRDEAMRKARMAEAEREREFEKRQSQIEHNRRVAAQRGLKQMDIAAEERRTRQNREVELRKLERQEKELERRIQKDEATAQDRAELRKIQRARLQQTADLTQKKMAALAKAQSIDDRRAAASEIMDHARFLQSEARRYDDAAASAVFPEDRLTATQQAQALRAQIQRLNPALQAALKVAQQQQQPQPSPTPTETGKNDTSPTRGAERRPIDFGNMEHHVFLGKNNKQALKVKSVLPKEKVKTILDSIARRVQGGEDMQDVLDRTVAWFDSHDVPEFRDLSSQQVRDLLTGRDGFLTPGVIRKYIAMQGE